MCDLSSAKSNQQSGGNVNLLHASVQEQIVPDRGEGCKCAFDGMDKKVGRIVFGALFSHKSTSAAARDLYIAVVKRMREPVFYEDFSVSDTLPGRFDLLMVHVFLLLHRLKTEGEAAKGLAQEIFDIMICDLDQNLREMGIGDEGVRHRIKDMSEGYHGRVVAYEQALGTGDAETQLHAALHRNLYAALQVPDAHIAHIARYFLATRDHLANQPFAKLRRGDISFGSLP